MFSLSFPILLTSFVVIFLAEIPDKTSLASLVLATRYRAIDVIIGAWLAFVIQTIVAVFGGSLLTIFPAQPIHIISGIGFLVFAFLVFRNKKDTLVNEEREIANIVVKKNQPAWLKSFIIIFAAEWGDLTQLATLTLVARLGNSFSVSIGAILALWLVTVIAVLVGSHLGKIFSLEKLRILSGVLFLVIGLYVIITAF